MPAHEEQMSGGAAPGRVLPRALLLALMCATALVAESPPAAAFELFGIKLWGSSNDEDADIVNPLRYAVTITAPDADVMSTSPPVAYAPPWASTPASKTTVMR